MARDANEKRGAQTLHKFYVFASVYSCLYMFLFMTLNKTVCVFLWQCGCVCDMLE